MRRLSNKRHCFPAGLIRRSVRLYASFNLSCRNVEEMLAERGLNISHETVRRRILKFGSAIAAKLRRTSAISSNDRCTRSLEPHRSTLGNAQAWRLELGSEPAKL